MCAGGGGGGGESEADRMDREDRELGQSQRPGTFISANSWLGRLTGDNRSDQQIENDQRQTDAIERGDRTFERVEGGRASTAGYRDLVAPQAGGLLARMNQAPSIGLFSSAASLAPFPANIPGRVVGGMIDDRLGTRVTLGSSGNIRFGN
jgi:hypothetical protein